LYGLCVKISVSRIDGCVIYMNKHRMIDNVAVPISDDMKFVHTVMKNLNINCYLGYLPLVKTKNVCQRSLWHRMHYCHLHSGVLR